MTIEDKDFKLGLYRHYKGGYYTALGLVKHHEGSPMVLYVCCKTGEQFVRPLRGWGKDYISTHRSDPDGWLDLVEIDDKPFGTKISTRRVPRFTFVSTPTWEHP